MSRPPSCQTTPQFNRVSDKDLTEIELHSVDSINDLHRTHHEHSHKGTNTHKHTQLEHSRKGTQIYLFHFKSNRHIFSGFDLLYYPLTTTWSL